MAEELIRCRRDPVRFNETILCRAPYWDKQAEIIRSVVDSPITVAVTGNGVGKSYGAVGVILWFAMCHPGCRIVVAAPTAGQLSGVVWAELEHTRALAARNGIPLGGRNDGLRIDFADGWTIEGFGQGSVESKSGRHAQHLLAVVDEASGVKASVLEAIDSLNPSRKLYLGNPLRAEGKFYELAERSGDNPHVRVFRLPSTASPDIDCERSRRGMADRTWLELCRHEYGEDSQWWLSHVLAMFPGELASTLLPAAWLDAAAKTVHAGAGPRRLGIDIAKGTGRDDSTLVVRDDTGILAAKWSNRWSLDTLAKEANLYCEEFGIEGPHITYDATGVGTDFDNRLRALGIHGSKGYMGAYSGGDKFSNLRSAAGWAFRRRLDPTRSAVKPDERSGNRLYVPQLPFAIPEHLLRTFRAELTGARYQLDEKGRIQLEPKEELIARLKRSPNFLDATLVTFAYPYA